MFAIRILLFAAIRLYHVSNFWLLYAGKVRCLSIPMTPCKTAFTGFSPNVALTIGATMFAIVPTKSVFAEHDITWNGAVSTVCNAWSLYDISDTDTGWTCNLTSFTVQNTSWELRQRTSNPSVYSVPGLVQSAWVQGIWAQLPIQDSMLYRLNTWDIAPSCYHLCF